MSKKVNKKIKKNNSKTISYIPSYKINNKSDFSSVTMTLKSYQTFIVEAGSLFFVKQKPGKENKIQVKTRTGGILSGIARYLFSGETLFQNYFSAPKNNSVEITFGGPMPGDILVLKLEPGQKYNISQGSFLASSDNIKVQTKFRARGIFMNEGAFLTKVKNIGDQIGIVFLACFGNSTKVVVPDGEEYLVDNGLFLASEDIPKKKLYTITKLSGYKSFFFGSEGILMKFSGPCELYTQNRNIGAFSRLILSYAPTPSNNSISLPSNYNISNNDAN